MSTEFIDPVPDRRLLDHNFEGYKLSLQNKNVLSCRLSTPVLRIPPDRKNYSVIHARVFGFRNYLVGERTQTTENVYFVDRTKNVRRVKLSENKSQLEICKVWKFPDYEDVPPSNDSQMYNPSIKIISNSLAIASDGIRTFFLLDTGDRSTNNGNKRWDILHSEELLQGKGFYIQDAVLRNQELNVLLCSIEHGNRRSHLAVHWVALINESNIWRQKSLKELNVSGDTGYMYLERSCEAIYIASTNSCKFVFDSENIIMDSTDDKKDAVSKLNFKWSQDTNYVAIHFILPNDIVRDDVNVEYNSSYIKVEYRNTSLLEGALHAIILTNLTTISVSKNLLEITLAKSDEGDEWSSVLRDYDTSKQYVGGTTSDLADLSSDELENPEQGIRFNKDAVDECAYTNSEHVILERLCGTTHKVTHRCSLGITPLMLTMEPTNIDIPKIGVRYDVDVIMWEPWFQSGQFQIKHTTTLLGLGYIAGNTEHKKFMCCPSNFEYTVISDTNKHVFLYRQHRNIEEGELINRRTGSRPKKAEQKVFSVPKEEILGIYCVPSGFYVLGETYVMYMEV